MDNGEKAVITNTDFFDPVKWYFQQNDLDDSEVAMLLDLWKQQHLTDDAVYNQIVNRIKNPHVGWKVRYYQARWVIKWFWPLLILIVLSNWLAFISVLFLTLFLAVPQVIMWVWGIIKFSTMFILLCVANLEMKLKVGAFADE